LAPHPDVAIRPAATIILIRDPAGTPAVLIGQRPLTAAFLPGKWVFPGGAVDPQDRGVDVGHLPDRAALITPDGPSPSALAAAAIREVWEETGLIIGTRAPWPDPPPAWAGFAATGFRPDARACRFMFRALTPPGMARRFDTRFFAAPASAIHGNPDALGGGDGELASLHWADLTTTDHLDMVRVSRHGLTIATARLPDLIPQEPIPRMGFVADQGGM
jgi:8-oxo-dGTP pyrophosphatase MutT (NUDIX family)